MTPEQQLEKDEAAREWRRAYYIANKDKIKARTKLWKAENPERKRELNRDYKARNPDKLAAYAAANKVEIAVKQAAKYQKNKVATKVYGAKRYQEKKVEIDAKNAAYAAKNYAAVRNKQREYKQNRLKTDPSFKLIALCARRMHHALKGVAAKSAKTMALLGCDGDFLRQHLENLFTEGMTWETQGKWQIDHHIPVASFDLTIAEQQQKCFHYSNLRPLWATDNRTKWHNVPDTPL